MVDFPNFVNMKPQPLTSDKCINFPWKNSKSADFLW